MTEKPTHDHAEGDETEGPQKPLRTCVGCGQHSPPEEFFRVVCGPQGPLGSDIAFDLAGGSFGRGAWIHASRRCFERAAKSGLAKSFKGKIAADFASLVSAFHTAAARRLLGLISSARRAHGIAVGADATFEALASGCRCVVVAADAKSMIERREIAAAISRGDAVSFGTKQSIGALFNREEVAVFAVTRDSLAWEIQRVCGAAQSLAAMGNEAAWFSVEVR